jgi:hypothetical protein
LYFVRPVDLAYTRASTDPVFPATESTDQMMANGDRLYVTPLKRSAVFACADTYTIRHPKHRIEWQVRYQSESALNFSQWEDPNVLASLHMLNMSYLAPSHFASQYPDMATHFNAPRRIRSFVSSPLDEQQWKLEVRKMFSTELSLQQFHILGIAQGAGNGLPYARNLLEDFSVNARAQIVFSGPGWKNIKVAELMGFVCACLLCWIMTIECEDGPKGKALFVLVVSRSMWICCICMVQSARRILHQTWVKLEDVVFEPLCAWIERRLARIEL